MLGLAEACDQWPERCRTRLGGWLQASRPSSAQTLAAGRWGGCFCSRARVSRFSMERSCFFFARLSLAGFRICKGGGEALVWLETWGHSRRVGAEASGTQHPAPRQANTYHLDDFCLAFILQTAFQVLGSALLLLLECTGEGLRVWEPGSPGSSGLRSESWGIPRGEGKDFLAESRSFLVVCGWRARGPPWLEGPDST